MCSIEEAYQTFSESRNDDSTELPTQTALFGSPDAERRKKKKRRGVLPPPEPLVIEPDRPAHRQLPPAELLGAPPTENKKTTSVSEMLDALESENYFPYPTIENQDKDLFNLQPEWATVFNDNSAPSWIKDRMPQRQAEVPLVPSPWMDGAPTLWQKIDKANYKDENIEKAAIEADRRFDDIQRKLDSMFDKLDNMEITRGQSNHLEIILFVLGGIFLILLLDLLVKQGTQATMMIAAAGGSMLKKARGGRMVNVN
jgi:hypothetical protein